jgi:hypothetical protein
MGKVIDYAVVDGWDGYLMKISADTLRQRVLELLNQGWEPLGGVAVKGDLYIQAMVKRQGQ